MKFTKILIFLLIFVVTSCSKQEDYCDLMWFGSYSCSELTPSGDTIYNITNFHKTFFVDSLGHEVNALECEACEEFAKEMRKHFANCAFFWNDEEIPIENLIYCKSK